MFVYVIADGMGRHKIGISRDPHNRAAGINQALDVDVCFTLNDPAALAVERRAHALLRADRLRGEWFGVTQEQAISAVMAARADVREFGGALFHPLHVAARASAALAQGSDAGA